MTDTKVFSPKLITYQWVGTGGIVKIKEPTATEVNAGVNLSLAVADDGTEVGPSASSDIKDRAITDAGNAVEAGADQYAATITLFRPFDMDDVTDPYVIAYNLFKTQRVAGFIVKRSNVSYLDVFAAGDMVSVFKVLSDYTADDTAGEDSVKLKVEFLPQGAMSVNTYIKSATTQSITPATLAIDVGEHGIVTSALEGWDVTQGSTWASSDTTVATVSENGVVTGVAAGSANITAHHPASAAASTACAVTVT